MEVVHERCAGMDVSKRDAKVCLRTPGNRAGSYTKSVATFGSVTAEVLRLREHLIASNVTLVVMEATGAYWKPFYYLLEDAPFKLMLVNPAHAKGLPGRKTDVSDAQWLAELGAHGLVRGSFVPPQPIRELRDLTRTRVTMTRDRAREINRLEKLLEDAGIKLSSVATDILGVSGRAMLDALVAGQRDPAVLAGLARMSLRNKTEQLTQALRGRFTDHHAFLVRLHLQVIDGLAQAVEELTARITTALEAFTDTVRLLTTIPGISDRVASTIIAETGADMSKFPTAGHLASWAGVCPGHHESAGRIGSTKTRPGNAHLKAALGNAVMGATRRDGSYLQARYRRRAARSTRLKALVATEHALLTAIWHMLTTGQPYRDLGGDYYLRRDPEATKRRNPPSQRPRPHRPIRPDPNHRLTTAGAYFRVRVTTRRHRHARRHQARTDQRRSPQRRPGRPPHPALLTGRPTYQGCRPMNAASRSTAGASSGTDTISPNGLPAPRYWGGSVSCARRNTSSASASVHGTGWPVAVARSQPCVTYSMRVMLSTICPGWSPPVIGTDRSSPPDRQPVSMLAVAARRSSAAPAVAWYDDGSPSNRTPFAAAAKTCTQPAMWLASPRTS